MSVETKDRIIETGARIIHRQGFNNTGIKEILDEAGVPKGSFYFYFKNKEDFGLSVIDHFNAKFAVMTEDILKDGSSPPLKRLNKLLDFFMDFFRHTEYSCGCPIGNLSQEMGDLSAEFSKKLSDSIDAMAGMYAKLLTEAADSGEIGADIDIEETAYFIVSSWHGALIRMKVLKSDQPLKSHKRFILENILACQG